LIKVSTENSKSDFRPILVRGIVLFLIISIAIIIVGFWYYEAQKKRQLDEYGLQLSAITDLKNQQIRNWRQDRLANAHVISRNPWLYPALQALQGGAKPEIPSLGFRDWLGTFQKDYGYRDVYIFGARGALIFRMRADSAEDLPPGIQRAVNEALRSGMPFLTDIIFSVKPGLSSMFVLAPVRDATDVGRPVGVIVCHIDPRDFLYPLIQTWPTPSESAESLLIRREGDEVLYLNELRHRKGTAGRLRFPLSKPRLPAAAAALGREAIIQGIDYRSVPVLAATRTVPDSPWFLVAKVDLEEILMPLRSEGRILLLLCVALIGAAAGATGTLIRREQIRHLRLERNAQRERLKAEAASRMHEDRYSKLFENMVEGFAYCRMLYEGDDPRDFIYLAVNPAFEKQTGLKDAAGKPVSQVIPGIREADPGLFEIYGRVARSGIPERFETEVKSLNLWFSVTVYSPEYEHFVAVFDVITTRKKAEAEILRLNAELEDRVRLRTAQLEEANRELGTFSYSVSHDLRAPLRIIDGFSQALLEDYKERIDPEGRDFLDRIRANAQFMGHLIDDMLKLARVSRTETSIEDVDLSALARQSAADIARAYPGRVVDLDIAEDLNVRSDPHLLRVVFDNLFDNAWKFTGRTSRPSVKFGAAESEHGPAYFVRDNGVGFDMAYVGKLFGAFQRLHAKEEFPGTGIGLATVQRIILRLGGRVWAEGGEGRGAAFFFTLNEPERRII